MWFGCSGGLVVLIGVAAIWVEIIRVIAVFVFRYGGRMGGSGFLVELQAIVSAAFGPIAQIFVHPGIDKGHQKGRQDYGGDQSSFHLSFLGLARWMRGMSPRPAPRQSGALVVSASACNSPFAPSIFPLSAA